jgi:hypothetical protein
MAEKNKTMEKVSKRETRVFKQQWTRKYCFIQHEGTEHKCDM